MERQQVLDGEFLQIRAKLIEIGAALDRIDRADGPAAADRRKDQIRQAIESLAADKPCRAETLQLLFSLPYNPNWRTALDVPALPGQDR